MEHGFLVFLKNLFFPISCLVCGVDGSWCCSTCQKAFSPIAHQRCPSCPRPTPGGQVCIDCLPGSELDGITALFDYNENAPLAKLIKTIKYQNASDILSVLPKIFSGVEKRVWEHIFYTAQSKVVCVPVPLHPRRERERGFNQAERIARALVEGWLEEKIILEPITITTDGLARVRYTRPQAELNAMERRTNLMEAFLWQSTTPPPDHIILVDDVFTTGSTMQECARELKRRGAKWVWGLTLARG